MLDQKYKLFIQKLIESTENKTVKWKLGGLINSYECSIPPGKVIITKKTEIPGFYDIISVKIMNKENISADIAQEREDKNNEDYTLLLSLHKKAINNAKDIDGTIDSMLEYLG